MIKTLLLSTFILLGLCVFSQSEQEFKSKQLSTEIGYTNFTIDGCSGMGVKIGYNKYLNRRLFVGSSFSTHSFTNSEKVIKSAIAKMLDIIFNFDIVSRENFKIETGLGGLLYINDWTFALGDYYHYSGGKVDLSSNEFVQYNESGVGFTFHIGLKIRATRNSFVTLKQYLIGQTNNNQFLITNLGYVVEF